MKKTRRILATIGVVLLVLMYASTLFFALFESTATFTMFKISIACTMIIPVLLYAYTMIYKLANKNDDSDSTEE